MTHRLAVEACALVVVDLQERLLKALPSAASLVERATFLVETARLLNVPILATEQYPKGLGPTVPALRSRLPSTPHEKTAFSVLGCDELKLEWQRLRKTTVVLAGAEAHVCVLQSAFDFLAFGVRVVVAADAVGSRFRHDHDTALERLRHAGAVVTTVEMIAFEWLVDSKHPAFKAASGLVRGLTAVPVFPPASGES